MSRKSRDTLDNAHTRPARHSKDDMLLAGRYRQLGRLGQGGMGEVYLAEDTELSDEKVAIKFIPPIMAGNARAIKGLRREAQMALQLSHQNIIRLRDLHTDGQQKFLVMEHIDGKTLEDILVENEDERFTLEQLYPIAEQIAAGLDYAHSRNVLHRDLKPSNIMIDKSGRVVLLDFGIAREMRDSYTRITGKESPGADTSGTLPYMSPEQLMGEVPNAAMDIYSFGAVLYECLSGNPPFSTGDIREQIKIKIPPVIKGLDKMTNSTLLLALSKEPMNRPKSACELVSEIWPRQTMLGHSPRHSKRVKSSFGRWAAITAAVLVVLGAGGWYFGRDYIEKIIDGIVTKTSSTNAPYKSSELMSRMELAARAYRSEVSVTPVPGYPEKKGAIARNTAPTEGGRLFEVLFQQAIEKQDAGEWADAIDFYEQAKKVTDNGNGGANSLEVGLSLKYCRHCLYRDIARDQASGGQLVNAKQNYEAAIDYLDDAKINSEYRSVLSRIGQREQLAKRQGRFNKRSEMILAHAGNGSLKDIVGGESEFRKLVLDFPEEAFEPDLLELNGKLVDLLLAFAKTRMNKTEGVEALKAIQLVLDLQGNHEYADAKKLELWQMGFRRSRTNSVGMEFVELRPGEFTMGAPLSESGTKEDEWPQRSVTLTKWFFIGKYEVSQEQWHSVMGTNPSEFKGDNLPVENVSLTDAMAFCKKLSDKENIKYRLPTEAQWEYACRGNTSTAYNNGFDSVRTLRQMCWCSYDGKPGSAGKTKPIGSFKHSGWGLYDMHGNVWEWCSDRYGKYSGDSEIDPKGLPKGEYCVVRGGSWFHDSQSCRSASRQRVNPKRQHSTLGFRVVIEQ